MTIAKFTAAESGAEVTRVNLWNTVPVVVIKSRKAPKPLARAKSSKGFVSGTSGFSMGYPKSDLLSKFTGHKSTGHF